MGSVWSANFSSNETSATSDPFSSAPAVTRSKTSTDPFGASANFASVIPPNKTISSPPSKSSQNRLQKSQTTANVSGATSSQSKVSQSLARPWGSPTDPFGANSSGGT